LIGLAVLAKTVNLGLLPIGAVCWLAALFRDRTGEAGRVTLIKGVVSAVALLLGFLVVTQSEFRANWERFGSPAVMQESVTNRANGRGTADLIRTTGSIAWDQWARKLWFRNSVMCGGWSWASNLELSRNRHEVLAGIGLLGWAWFLVPAARRRALRLFRVPVCPLLCLTIGLGFTGALAYHSVQSQLCWGSIATNPWYAAAAYPSFLLLVSAGAFAWPIGRFSSLVPCAIALVFLEAEACGVLGSMTAVYAALAPWEEALRRLAVLQPPLLGTTTLYTAMAGTLVFTGLALLAVLHCLFQPPVVGEPKALAHIMKLRAAGTATARQPERTFS
jgi:hypothetical protein